MHIEKAFLYRFLAEAFSYPTEERLKVLESALEDLERVIEILNLHVDLKGLSQALKKAQEDPIDLQGEFTSLFETQMRAPARETSYELDKTGRRSMEMADIEGFYRAFGLKIAEPIEPDSFVAEAEFCSILNQKMYFLKEKGDEEGYTITKEAYEKFLRDHLGRWYEIFVEKLFQEANHPLYKELAFLVKTFLDKETSNIDGISKLSIYRKETLEGSSWECGFVKPQDPNILS